MALMVTTSRTTVGA